MNDWNGIYICHPFNQGSWCCSRNCWFFLDISWTLVLVHSFKWKWTYILYWTSYLQDEMRSKWVLWTSGLQECKSNIFLKSGRRASILGRGGWAVAQSSWLRGAVSAQGAASSLYRATGTCPLGFVARQGRRQSATTTCDYLHWQCAHQVADSPFTLQLHILGKHLWVCNAGVCWGLRWGLSLRRNSFVWLVLHNISFLWIELWSR